MAPDDPNTVKEYKNNPDNLLRENKVLRSTVVDVVGSTDSNNGSSSKAKNSTDEEKALIREKTLIRDQSSASSSGGGALRVSGGLEGQFVERQSATPFASEMLVTAEVNPQS